MQLEGRIRATAAAQRAICGSGDGVLLYVVAAAMLDRAD
jgi:hypothetical protein